MPDFFDDDINENEDEDIIILHDELTDKDEEFYHLATLDVDGKWYIVMQPVEPETEEDALLYIYRIVTDDKGESTFEPIEDEAELDKVYNEFLAEVEKFEESECDCGCDECHHDCHNDQECNCDDCHHGQD